MLLEAALILARSQRGLAERRAWAVLLVEIETVFTSPRQHLRNAQVWAQKRKDEELTIDPSARKGTKCMEDAAEQAAELAKSLRPAWQTQVQVCQLISEHIGDSYCDAQEPWSKRHAHTAKLDAMCACPQSLPSLPALAQQASGVGVGS